MWPIRSLAWISALTASSQAKKSCFDVRMGIWVTLGKVLERVGEGEERREVREEEREDGCGGGYAGGSGGGGKRVVGKPDRGSEGGRGKD